MQDIKGIILFGGAFNPPTIAHKQIGEFLLDKFKNANIIYLPTNSFYNKADLASFNDRFQMVKLLTKEMERTIVSDYEGKEHKFSGTYYTLAHFNHPYFVIGADSLKNLSTWINGNDLIKENKFIVFPRYGYDIDDILKQDILKDNIDNFIIIDDYVANSISSSLYRNTLNDNILTKEVKKYIEEKGLYR